MCCDYVSPRLPAHLLLAGSVLAALVKSTDQNEKSNLDWPIPAEGLDGAYKDCPCIRMRGNMSLANFFADSVEVVEEEDYLIIDAGSGSKTIPVDYGTNRCSDWDASGTYSDCDAQIGRPAWCDAKWCYVNTTTCQRPKVASSYGLVGLSYSYQTCGFLNFYLSPSMMNWTDTGPLYAFAFGHAATENPQSESKVLNMYLEFAAVVLTQVGIELDGVRYRQGLSNATRRATPSTYTGCVRDIALGNLDLCLGDLWDTEERQSFGAASFIMVGSERMRLLGPAIEEEDEDFETLIRKPFSPFADDLWAMIFSVVIGVAFLMLIFEYNRPGSDFGDRTIVYDIGKSIYLATTSLLSASITYTSVTRSGRAIAVGYMIFIIVGIASFTAETASFLIQKSTIKQPVVNLRDAMQRSHKVCYSGGMQAMLERKHPRMKMLGVPVDGTGFNEYADRMNDGTCTYSIVGELWPDSAWREGKHCNFNFIGPTVLDFPTGYWVQTDQNDLRKHLSWAVAVLRARGVLAALEQRYGSDSICPGHESRRLRSSDETETKLVANRRLKGLGPSFEEQSSDTDGPQPLRASHMYGTLIIVGFLVLVATVFRCFEITCYGVSDQDKQLAERVTEQTKESLHLHKHHRYLLHAKDIASQFAHAAVSLGKNAQSVVLLEKDANKISHDYPIEVIPLEALKRKITTLGVDALELEAKTLKLLDQTHEIVNGFANLPSHSVLPEKLQKLISVSSIPSISVSSHHQSQEVTGGSSPELVAELEEDAKSPKSSSHEGSGDELEEERIQAEVAGAAKKAASLLAVEVSLYDDEVAAATSGDAAAAEASFYDNDVAVPISEEAAAQQTSGCTTVVPRAPERRFIL